jgi:hypothetical protein
MLACFDELVAPLELASGWRLNGEHRRLCTQAFEEYPEGFRLCAAKALRRAHTNPVGLLVKMEKKDGEHRRAGRSLAPEAPPTPLERMLSWAGRTAPRLEPNHREDILAESGLDEDEIAAVRAAVVRSLEGADLRRRPPEAA